jgi:hypothetical protein
MNKRIYYITILILLIVSYVGLLVKSEAAVKK